jgi:hypothetical protein
MNCCELVGFEVLTASTMKRTLWRCNAEASRSSPIFQRNVLPPFSRLTRRKLPARSRQLPGLIFDREDAGGMFLQNIGEHLPDYTALLLRR